MIESILVIDDEPDIRTFLSTNLSIEGYRVTTASDGAEGLEHFLNHPADLVITDMRMPKVGGLEVLHEVKKMDNHTEVIILTGYGSLQNAIDSMKNDGAFHYFTKPLKCLDEFLATVKRALEYRRIRLHNQSLITDLECAKNRYLDLFDNAPVGYGSLNSAGDIVEMNRTGAELLGYDKKELLHHSIHTLMDEKVVSSFSLAFNEVVKTGEPASLELPLICQSGNDHWYRIELRHLSLGTNDEIMRFTFVDINDTKRAEQQLADSRNTWQKIMRSSPSHIFILDEDNSIQTLNTALPETQKEDLLHSDFCSIFHTPSPGTLKVFLENVKNKAGKEHLELSYRTGSGETAYYYLRSAPIYKEGNRCEVVVNLIDITKRKSLEAEILAERNRLDILIRSLQAGLFVLVPNFEIAWVNKVEIEKHWDIVGTKCHEIFMKKDVPCSDCPICSVLSGEVMEARVEHLVDRGRLGSFWYECSLSPISNENKEIDSILVLFRDVSAKKKAIEEHLKLERAQATIRKEQAIRILSGGIAYRFSNSLAMLSGHLQRMQFEKGWDDSFHSYRSQMYTEIGSMVEHTQKLLNYSRNEMSTQLKPLRLDECVRDYVSSNRSSLFGERKLNYVYDGIPVTIKGDITQIEMVITALLTNAVEATIRKDPITVTVSHKTRFETEMGDTISGDYACLLVEDTGHGMDEKTCQSIYDPYFSTKFAGRGLGLASVKGIIENYKGHIRVSSRINEGTTVEVYIPLI